MQIFTQTDNITMALAPPHIRLFLHYDKMTSAYCALHFNFLLRNTLFDLHKTKYKIYWL